jgi:hypothetical protein
MSFSMCTLLKSLSVIVIAGGLFVNSVAAQVTPFAEGEFVRKVDPALAILPIPSVLILIMMGYSIKLSVVILTTR